MSPPTRAAGTPAAAAGRGAVPQAFALPGARAGRLFGGPPPSEGAERLASHLGRLGPMRLAGTPAALRATVAESGLVGRGGGEFPLARKLEGAAASDGAPIVVVNASEGEPASRKDRTLLALRPHLVLDGASAAAYAIDAPEVVVYLHRARRSSAVAIEQALRERPPAGPEIRVVDAPDRYVAGESSAVVSYLEGAGALPRRRPHPVARAGVGGRPTVVSNAETLAHLGLIARLGAAWFAEAGEPARPGSTLVTVGGEVEEPGTVVEVLRPRSIGELLVTAGGLDELPRAVLVGGYAGTWIDGAYAWGTPLGRSALAQGGASLGCGLVAVLREGSCGIATTARLARWLAGESAGQCGLCAFGLPAIADLLEALSEGRAVRRDLHKLRRITASVQGRGACGHPSGVASLVESALDTFRVEVRDHLRGRRCDPAVEGFPLSPGGSGA